MSFDGTEGTDSTSTDTYDIGTITFSLMDSEVTCNPKKSTDSLTDSLNNMDLRDASASKNHNIYMRMTVTVTSSSWKGRRQ